MLNSKEVHVIKSVIVKEIKRLKKNHNPHQRNRSEILQTALNKIMEVNTNDKG